ncbi:helix-turn-helix domain-containing protein [Lentzea miocenica]|uniref:helix-turn-helix domain-containing protein n=1 Tax=Lentzea miocenica TaxID=3095431 RepID=UPI003873366F
MAAPTRAKKRLGDHLARLRDSAGRSLAQTAKELKTSDSTISRYESGHVLPNWASVAALCASYDASDEDRDTAARLWENASDEPRRACAYPQARPRRSARSSAPSSKPTRCAPFSRWSCPA